MGRRGKCPGMVHRVLPQLQGPPRLVEHENQRLASGVRLQEGDSKGQETWFQEQHDHLRNQRFLGMLCLNVIVLILSLV